MTTCNPSVKVPDLPPDLILTCVHFPPSYSTVTLVQPTLRSHLESYNSLLMTFQGCIFPVFLRKSMFYIIASIEKSMTKSEPFTLSDGFSYQSHKYLSTLAYQALFNLAPLTLNFPASVLLSTTPLPC